MKIDPNLIDPTIPHFEFLGITPSPDLDQSKTIYCYRLTIYGVPPFQYEGTSKDYQPTLQQWLSSVQKQYPEVFLGEDLDEDQIAFEQYLQELSERIEKTAQEVKSEMLSNRF